MTTTTIAGDVDYAAHGQGYGRQRRTDPRLAAWVHAALGDARSVLNVAAGAGSYEPTDRHVLAIEPSAAMRAQRPAHLTPAVDAVAEKLPLDDQSFDAAMALVTVHQWPDLAKGLQELRRVTRGPIVVLTFDGDALDRYWLADYASEMLAVERRRYPPIATLVEGLGGACEVHALPIPIDCVDGFSEAFYARRANRRTARRTDARSLAVAGLAQQLRRTRPVLRMGRRADAHRHLQQFARDAVVAVDQALETPADAFGDEGVGAGHHDAGVAIALAQDRVAAADGVADPVRYFLPYPLLHVGADVAARPRHRVDADAQQRQHAAAPAALRQVQLQPRLHFRRARHRRRARHQGRAIRRAGVVSIFLAFGAGGRHHGGLLAVRVPRRPLTAACRVRWRSLW
jgi:SAM-dependent methyltransferase